MIEYFLTSVFAFHLISMSAENKQYYIMKKPAAN